VLLSAVAAFAAATAIELLIGLLDGLAAPGVRTAHLVAACALVVLALATRVRPLLLWRARRAVAAATTTAEGGGAAPALAAVVGDPRLELAYALPDGGWVDARGRPVQLPERGVTLIRDEGTPVAALRYGTGVQPDEDLVSEAVAAARLRLDAERLEAVVLARVEQLRDARRRVVEASEEERRRLERDLHDGAQQRLVALRFALGLAQARAGGRPVAERVAAADAALERALASLRELAHGLYPPSLDADGLAIALRGAAERARIAVAVGTLPEDRLAPALERAVYRVIVDALALAERAGAGAARIEARAAGARIELRVEHDGGPVDDLGLLEDRVGALGGVLAVQRRSVVAEVPCA
jgi:signal transduction histidine kinase